MGLFSNIKNNYKKTEASLIIQNLLSQQANNGFFDKDPTLVANTIISDAWNAQPDIFTGKFGKRPHKLATAAAALSYKIANTSIAHAEFGILQICLGNILREYDSNGGFYPLSNIDHSLFQRAFETFTFKSEQYEASNSELLNEINASGSSPKENRPSQGVVYMQTQKYPTFEEWITAYNHAAMEANESLKPVDGLSLLDLLDDKPLIKAHQDLIDPIFLGKHFGKNFNPLDIGF